MDGWFCGSHRTRFSALRTHVSHRRSDRRWFPPFADAAEADQVVGGKRPGHPTAYRRDADHRQLAQPADGLDPAKALFDPFAHLLADTVVAGAPRHVSRHCVDRCPCCVRYAARSRASSAWRRSPACHSPCPHPGVAPCLTPAAVSGSKAPSRSPTIRRTNILRFARGWHTVPATTFTTLRPTPRGSTRLNVGSH